jgi:hypothetical protein
MSQPTLHTFRRELDETGTHYSLSSVRKAAVMVHVSLPGERWEVEFFEDREPEVEIFRSDGTIYELESVKMPASEKEQ